MPGDQVECEQTTLAELDPPPMPSGAWLVGDGTQAIVQRQDGAYELVDLVMGDVDPFVAIPAGDRLLDISGDGSTAIFSSVADLDGSNPDGNAELWAAPLDGGPTRAVTVTAGQGYGAASASASADASRVALRGDAGLVVVDDRANVLVEVARRESFGDVEISLDGSTVLWGDWFYLDGLGVPPRGGARLTDVVGGQTVDLDELPFEALLGGMTPRFAAADGSVAVFGDQQRLQRYDLVTNTVSAIAPGLEVSGSRPSADGSTILVQTRAGLARVDLASGSSTVLASSRTWLTVDDVTADGGAVLWSQQEGRVWRTDLGPPSARRGVRITASATDGSWSRALVGATTTGDGRVSQDGSTVVFHSSDDLGGNADRSSEIWVVERASGVIEALAPGALVRSTHPSVSADGRLVAFTSTADLDDSHPAGNADGTGEVFLADREAGTIRQLTDGGAVGDGTGESADTAIAAGGGVVAFTATSDLTGENPDHASEVFAYDVGDDQVHQLTDSEGPVEHRWLTTTPDGQHVGFSTWPANGGGTSTWLPEDPGAPALVTAGEEGLWPDGSPRRSAQWKGPRWSVQLPPEDRDALGRYDDGGPLVLTECPTFFDVSLDHSLSGDVEWMVDVGLTKGYTSGYMPSSTYRPSEVVTRQAMVAFLYRLAGAEEPAPTAAPFTDVGTAHPFAREIRWAADQEITAGYQDETFRPGGVVTRQAAVAFLSRLAEADLDPPNVPTFDDVPSSHPFFGEVEWAVAQGVVDGYADGGFRPGAAVTRQATAAFLHRAASLL